MQYILNLKRKNVVITDLAGSWDMFDEEWDEIKTSLTEVWKKWKVSGNIW